jgi:hypothetical protein
VIIATWRFTGGAVAGQAKSVVATGMRRISLVLVLGLAAAACHHENVAPPSNQAAPRPSATSDALAFLPLDADIVLGVDVAALRTSALWAEYQSGLTDLLGPQLASIQKTCGFDPIQTVESVTLAVSAKEGTNTVLVVRGLDRDRTIACLKTNVIPDTTVAMDRDVVSLTHGGGGRDVLAFADRSTLVLEGSKQPTPDGLRARLQGGAPLRGSPAFLEMFGRLERGATVWVVINGNASLFDKLAGTGMRPSAIYGTVHAAAGLGSKVHMRMPSPDQAKQLAATAQGQTQQAASMFSRLDVTAEGDVVTIALEMSLDNVRTMVSAFGILGGAMKSAPPAP